MKSTNTIETYRDALTIFRKYISDTFRLSIRTFCFEDCTHDLLLEFLHHLRERGNAETTCNNRLTAIRAYLWYATGNDISLQSVALTASHVPFLKVPKRIREIIEEEDLCTRSTFHKGLRERRVRRAGQNTAVSRRRRKVLGKLLHPTTYPKGKPDGECSMSLRKRMHKTYIANKRRNAWG